ncbi:nitroreductase [Aneurinibacillus aneurinilyticus]|uniref:Nitroreductase n=1 Tax=Aneurinibacillus aneurinilyticus TaxID=1391 RepID=A0A848CYK6_ANEAE|nr:nitroreductase [Aneurinibacillus aneurinilyticus]NME98917.1 nitroreductase [Aneurinibacillus aneurinilyticus]
MMLDISRIIFEGTILSFVFLAILLVSLYYNPRIWLLDYPKDIQKVAEARTKKENRQFYVIGTIIMSLIAVPFITSIYFEGNEITFLKAFLHLYIVFFMVSLADLIILDWLIFCLITPNFIIIPGTKGAKGYKDYLFHFIGFLKGAVMYGIFSLFLAGLRIVVTYF